MRLAGESETDKIGLGDREDDETLQEDENLKDALGSG